MQFVQYIQALILVAVLAASLWLWAVEGFIAAVVFFVFGLVVAGAIGFTLQIGDAAGGYIDRFIRRHGRRRR